MATITQSYRLIPSRDFDNSIRREGYLATLNKSDSCICYLPFLSALSGHIADQIIPQGIIHLVRTQNFTKN